jgi:hypothetical protein
LEDAGLGGRKILKHFKIMGWRIMGWNFVVQYKE